MKPLPLILTLGLLASARADEVDDLIQRAMKQQHIPGLALAVMRDGKPIKVKGYGLASLDYDTPVSTKTPFLLASITKTFTATSIMMLVEQGKLKLDDMVNSLLEGCPESWRGITVRHLLSHTGGLANRFEESPWSTAKFKLNYTTEEMFESATRTKVDAKPGEMFQYSDQGYFLLGMIIERVTGETYSGFLKKHIFDRLGMASSSTIQLSQIVKGLATGYFASNGKHFHNGRRTDFGMTSHFGIVSTVEDLMKWNPQSLLKPASVEMMWKPTNAALTYSPGLGSYGLGWFCDEFDRHPSVGHPGSTGTMFVNYPQDKLTVIVLTNLEQLTGGDAPGIAKAVAQSYIPGLAWSSLQPQPDPKSGRKESVKALLVDLAKGKLDESLLEATFLKKLKPQVSMQQKGLAALGPLGGVEFLWSMPLGRDQLSHYRLSYKETTLYATVRFTTDGKIAHLAVESASRY